MLKNYFKIAARNFIRHPGYSFINVSGLTVGVAVCLLIFAMVALAEYVRGPVPTPPRTPLLP
mgnify:CR=1 FL=1